MGKRGRKDGSWKREEGRGKREVLIDERITDLHFNRIKVMRVEIRMGAGGWKREVPIGGRIANLLFNRS
ncbi:hypothetical protein DRF65_16910 [Chryseobacterium pennae]|uniref:Uncharacterized protein n=1 Tax=Chryseobacterium pennae TaxID=2258962 RepID=A0A3D9C5N7_9FLAO|nr:hypothetical protein DRF65_16910 [Chryseobacterium pennae]